MKLGKQSVLVSLTWGALHGSMEKNNKQTFQKSDNYNSKPNNIRVNNKKSRKSLGVANKKIS